MSGIYLGVNVSRENECMSVGLCALVLAVDCVLIRS